MKTRPYNLDLQLFAEEVKQDQPEETVDPNANAVEAIKKLKETTVSREAYEAVVKQNKELFDTVINVSFCSKVYNVIKLFFFE